MSHNIDANTLKIMEELYADLANNRASVSTLTAEHIKGIQALVNNAVTAGRHITSTEERNLRSIGVFVPKTPCSLNALINSSEKKSMEQLAYEVELWMDSMLNKQARRPRSMHVETVDLVAERKADEEAKSRLQADKEFLDEVVDEIVAAGFARHVAYNMCNTEAKMMEQARKYGVI